MQNLVNPLRPQIWVVTLQGVTITQRVEDMIKSEWQLVISCIEVQNLPQPEKALTYHWYLIG